MLVTLPGRKAASEYADLPTGKEVPNLDSENENLLK